MTYLVFHDIDPKKTDERKRAEAVERFTQRFGYAPQGVYTTVEQTQVKATIALGALWLGPVEGL